MNKSWVRFAHDNGAYSSEYIGIGINYFNVCSAAGGKDRKKPPTLLEGMLKVRKGDIDHFELVYPCHSPMKDRWFLMYVTKYGSKKLQGIVVTHIDITARVMAEIAVEEAKKQSELYLDLMSHDINNLNQAALGYLELAMETSSPEESKRMMSKPIESLEDSSKLIDNVRTLKKVTSGTLNAQEIDLCHVLQKLREQYASVQGRLVTINFKHILGCRVIANELIMDVFSNLISNAIKHSDAGKPLDIDIDVVVINDEGREYDRVTIEDNGPGIPDTLKEKLFTRFQRGSTHANGTGLGLYLVKMLVEKFHGQVWVEDRVPGDYTKGTRFVVMLPAASHP